MDVSAYASVTDAEDSVESFDAEALTGYLDDGTRLELRADGSTYRCRMTPTTQREPMALRDRLRQCLSAAGLDPDLADDTALAAAALTARQRQDLWPRWPKWLHRLVHRSRAL